MAFNLFFHDIHTLFKHSHSLHADYVDFQLVLLIGHGIIESNARALKNNHSLIPLHIMLIISQQLPHIESHSLIQMMEYHLHLLLLVIPISDFTDAVWSNLSVVVMKVGCLADIAQVVFAHAYFLYAFLLVVFLFVEYWCQQAFLCVFLGMGVVILLYREVHQDQVALEYHNI